MEDPSLQDRESILTSLNIKVTSEAVFAFLISFFLVNEISGHSRN